MKSKTLIIGISSCLVALFQPWVSVAQGSDQDAVIIRPATLPDISGLAWVGEDLFVGAHDAKHYPDERDWPRVSLVRLPVSGFEGVTWEPQYISFPGPAGLASDLESISNIPGGKDFLFVESGQEGNGFRRIFHAVYDDGEFVIYDYIEWPVQVDNVEATDVCRINGQLYFFFAERAEGSISTKIRWAELSLAPLSLGEFEGITYTGTDPGGSNERPIVAMDIDTDGYIYVASAYDPGFDDGPFRSAIWLIGRVGADSQGLPLVTLGINERLGMLDGLKVESIAIRELPGKGKEIYFGTDDENYGGIIRLLTPEK